MRVLVTGSSGFVGHGLTAALAARGVDVRAAVRGTGEVPPPAVSVTAPDLGPDADWRPALKSMEVVVHLAARVHGAGERAGNPLDAYRRANTAGTLALARQAAVEGVRRLVFLSTLKVHGESGGVSEADLAEPTDPYALSKLEAEEGLAALAQETGLEVVIIRPPLVYGPGVKANFRALMSLVERGVPLPLGRVRNRRSFLALDNLVDFILTCVRHPAAAGRTFLVSDGEDLSTPELVRRLARAMGRPPRLLPVPVPVLWAGARLAGKVEAAERLLGSLYVAGSTAERVLGWRPPVSVDEGLRRAVAGAGS